MRPNKALLVKLLRIAAQLEHCLLNAYLYAACSLKSMPEEFEEIGDESNSRRAIQFERVRSWKASLLAASKEEMVHIHYVQCLLRALGEPPCFELPQRKEGEGWLFPNWQTMIDSEGEVTEEGDYVKVPINTLDEDTIKEFILYESSDLLQIENPFEDGSELKEVFGDLADFEFDLHLASVLKHVDDPAQYKALKEQLEDIYTHPITVQVTASRDEEEEEEELQKKYVRFKSIGDLYWKGILPLYEQAFELGWVTYDNLDLNNELREGQPAEAGLLPVGPFYRDKNFEKSVDENLKDPLRNYKDVRDIVREILIEGEGFANFRFRAKALLAKVEELGQGTTLGGEGEREYVEALIEDKNSQEPTPDWLANGQRLRLSHLYRFIIIWEELEQEQRGGSLSGETSANAGVAKRQKRRFWQKWNAPKPKLTSGSNFEPARQPISQEDVNSNLGLNKLTEELPAQFNACYLVLLAWLSRMYEIRDWQADKPRRQAIQMLASWPLMSMAIRPFLELASFFPVDLNKLYRIEPDYLPYLPPNARLLYEVYEQYITRENQQSRKTNCLQAAKEVVRGLGNPALEKLPDQDQLNLYMDYLAVRVLSDAAEWASEMIGVFDTTAEDVVRPNYQKMLLARLKELSYLGEFQKQFRFRVQGGYSNQLPDLTYENLHPNKEDYEEKPEYIPEGLYQDTLALRLRFSGYGLVQMATDPDPTADEVGCTGTHMLHANDYSENGQEKTYQYFDHALIWQDNDDKDPIENIICRDTGEEGPELGIKLTEASLVVTDGRARVRFAPIKQDLNVKGFLELLTVKAENITSNDICLNLRKKGETAPFLNGLNHIVWQDGEPIDPFILAVYQHQQDEDNIELFQREIFNQTPKDDQEKTLLDMSPLQRTVSSRGPSGFDQYINIPDWARANFSSEMKEEIGKPEYPMSFLDNRANNLLEKLKQQIPQPVNSLNREQVDTIVSLGERTRLVSIPTILPHTTTISWLKLLLHYGHTVSGKLGEVAGGNQNPIFTKIQGETDLQLSQDHSIENRNQPNNRWLAKYTKGVMDADALLDFVYFELYIPVKPNIDGSFTFTKEWTFTADIQEAVKKYGCDFSKPILESSYETIETGAKERTRKESDSVFGKGFPETLSGSPEQPGSYEYSSDPIDVDGASVTIAGNFGCTEGEDPVKLTWTATFTVKGDNEDAKSHAIVLAANFFAKDAQDMTIKLKSHFGPNNVN
ncbi:MAG: hypothetical protein F6J86_29080 [Symploca sp. SIO1B1]|nr:hypothetical protein [Symploca sp. SIO1B1]